MSWASAGNRSVTTWRMKVTERRFRGVFEVRLEPRWDARGSFMRTYDADLLGVAGVDRPWVQENQSRNVRQGIVRGLHFQFPPHAETKLVRCIRGSIFDVFVDLRSGSPTFGPWDGLVLSEEKPSMVLIPKGFAHGYCTLTEESEVLYKVDHPYRADSEGGLLWSDPDIGIDWPAIEHPELSEKDRKQISFALFKERFGALDVPGTGN